VFEFKQIGREDLDIGSAIYMSDGVIKMVGADEVEFSVGGGGAGCGLEVRSAMLMTPSPYRSPSRYRGLAADLLELEHLRIEFGALSRSFTTTAMWRRRAMMLS